MVGEWMNVSWLNGVWSKGCLVMLSDGYNTGQMFWDLMGVCGYSGRIKFLLSENIRYLEGIL